MKRWPTKLLRELCEFRHGNTPSKVEPRNWGGSFPWVSPKDMRAEMILDTEDHLSPEAIAAEHATIAKKDSLLVVVRSGILAHTFPVAIAGRDVAFNQDLKSLRVVSPAVTPSYLFRFLQASSPLILNRGTKRGATVHSIQSGFLESLPTPVPPLAEQERIVKLLDEADELRKLRAQADRRTAALIPALFHEMFGDPISNPNGWDVLTVRDLTSFVTSGSRGWAAFYSDQGARFIRVQNLAGHRLCLDDVAHVNPPETAESRRTRILPDDLLLAITGNTIGLSALASADIGVAYVSQHVAIIRLNANVVPDYIASFMALPRGGQHHIAEMQYGHTKPGVSLEQIRAMCVPLPPLLRQKEFAGRVTEIRELEAGQAASRRRLYELFPSLLHRAFTGELTQATAVTEQARKASSESVFLRRGAIAAYIISRLHSKPTFGRVQFAKLLFLTETHVGIDLEGHYKRQAAGPLDAALLDNLEATGKAEAWFTKHARAGDKAGYSYSPGSSIAERQAAAVTILGERQAEMDRLLAHVSRMRTEQAEIFATLFAAWNDFLLRGTTPSDDQIIREVRENWHSKKARFAPGRLAKALAWMRKHSFTPRGIGPATAAAALQDMLNGRDDENGRNRP